jgi:hypothetical protein
MTKQKQIVHYKGEPVFLYGVALVHPVDHPFCSNGGKAATTSLVRKPIDENGVFETENSIYVPVQKA